MLKFVQDVIKSFPIGKDDVQIGVTIFSRSIYTPIKLNSYHSKAQLVNAVRRISFMGGGTPTGDGIRHITRTSFSSSYGSRSNVPKIGIVVTDGASNSMYSTLSAAAAARNRGIKLFAIGIGSGVHRSELKGIANDPDRNFYFGVYDFNYLKAIEGNLVSKACKVLIDSTSGCNARADLVFLVDGSGSVGSANFQTTLNFMSDIVASLDISKDKFQVGVVSFQSKAKVEFNLNTYMNKKDIQNAIKSINYVTGGTNTGDAIEYLHSTAFSHSSGHRNGRRKIGILITDGKSYNPRKTRDEARKARLSGIKMFSIGVGYNVDVNELKNVASKPTSQYVFTAANFNSLKSIKSSVLSKACQA